MAPRSWIQRLGAACAGLALVCALLAPPPGSAAPGSAAPERPQHSPSQEIGAGGSPLVGVVPSATKRGTDGTPVSLRVVVAAQAAASSTAGRRQVPVGGEAPALARWRLSHGTSTSIP